MTLNHVRSWRLITQLILILDDNYLFIFRLYFSKYFIKNLFLTVLSSYFTKVREERARGKTSEQRRISHIPRLHGGTPLSCHPLLSLNITEKIESPIEFAGKDLEPHSKCKLLNKLQHLISLLSRCSFYKS